MPKILSPSTFPTPPLSLFFIDFNDQIQGRLTLTRTLIIRHMFFIGLRSEDWLAVLFQFV